MHWSPPHSSDPQCFGGSSLVPACRQLAAATAAGSSGKELTWQCAHTLRLLTSPLLIGDGWRSLSCRRAPPPPGPVFSSAPPCSRSILQRPVGTDESPPRWPWTPRRLRRPP